MGCRRSSPSRRRRHLGDRGLSGISGLSSLFSGESGGGGLSGGLLCSSRRGPPHFDQREFELVRQGPEARLLGKHLGGRAGVAHHAPEAAVARGAEGSLE